MEPQSDRSIPISHAIASFVSEMRYEQLPGSFVEFLKDHIIDVVGTSIAATRFDFAYRALAGLAALADSYGSTVVGMAGQVNIYFSSVPGALSHIKGGELRALGVSSLKRSSAAPDVPTVAESGYAGFEAINWLGLLVPVRTPASIVSRLNADVLRVFQQPDVEQKFLAQGGEPTTGTPEAFASYIKSETAKWDRVIKASGVKPE